MEFFPSRHVALQLGPVAIHWYGVMYLLAFLFVWTTLPKLQKYRSLSLSRDDISSLMIYGILGTIIGGRLGYVVLYDFSTFLQNPLEILKVWHGGMASHGGFIGVIVSVFLFCRKYNVNVWKLADVLVIPVAVGLALGRVGNFINEELYGVVTTLPWGMQFGDAEGLRHPTQIYAVVKDLLIAGVCFLHLKAASSKQQEASSGKTLGLFLVLYSILRSVVEIFRVQTIPKIWTGAFWMTYGQLLTIPLFIAGVVILLYRHKAE
jgi:phosphatidylglycerol:prolipoprotein diacylglycerol transferase